MTDLLSAASRPVQGIRTGIGGGAFSPWRDNLDPKGLVHKRELEYASRHLSAIETNGARDGAQMPAVYAGGREQAPDGFVFSLKTPRNIVGAGTRAGTAEQIAGFVEGGSAALGDRLGPLLWQFAPQRRCDADDVRAWLAVLPDAVDGLPLRRAVEVRHPSFPSEARLRPARARGVATVFTEPSDDLWFADAAGDVDYARLMSSREEHAQGYPGLQRHA